jgi:hypothetical protein
MANILPATPVHDAATALSAAVVSDIHTRLASLEAAAKADENKVIAFFKAQWPHIVTWATAAATALKVFGKL